VFSVAHETDRVLVHVDTERAGEKLVNRRLAYVAISRGRYDAHLYTNDAVRFGEAFSRKVSKSAVLEVEANRGHGRGEPLPAKQLTAANVPEREQVGRAQATVHAIGFRRGHTGTPNGGSEGTRLWGAGGLSILT
jgi:hypothetical protein